MFILPKHLTFLNVIVLIWNLTLFWLATKDFSSTVYFDDAHIKKSVTQKPFLLLLFKYNAKYNFSIAYIIGTLYYLFAMPKIIPLLDCLPFSAYYRRKSKVHIVILVAILLTVYLFTFLEIHIGIVRALMGEKNGQLSLRRLTGQLGLFVHFIYGILPYAIAHYAQLGTLVELGRIKESVPKVSIKEVKCEIKNVALVNAKVHKLNSLPFLLCIVTNCIDALVSTCRLNLDPDLGYFIYVIVLLTYQLYLSGLNSQTKVVLSDVIKQCKTKFSVLKKGTKTFVSHTALKDYCGNDLNITVFKLLTIDYTFLFLYLLFLLNYGVFLSQTKTKHQ